MSMFKRSGGLSFKPKLPPARPRPPAVTPLEEPPPAGPVPPVELSSPQRAPEPRTVPRPRVHESYGPTTSDSIPGLSTVGSPNPSAANRNRPIWPSVGGLNPLPRNESPSDRLSGNQILPSISSSQPPDSVPVDALAQTAPHQFAPDALPGLDQEATISPSPAGRDAQRYHRPSQHANGSTDPTAGHIRADDQQVENPQPRQTRRGAKRGASQNASQAETEQSPKRPRRKPQATPNNAKRRKQAGSLPAADAAVPAPAPTKKRAGRRRSVTPEGAESEAVDLHRLKMADLTKDLHIGKKFSRHDELKNRSRTARVTKGSQDPSEELASLSSNPSGSSRAAAPRLGENTTGPSTGASTRPIGPQFEIIDGQIVVNQTSLVMDRHARAAAATEGQEVEEVEENDFTRLINSNSYMTGERIRGPNRWTEAETERFYRALRMCGTDFGIIAQMFPGKHRRHVKMKFNREERASPRRIDDALMGEKCIKMDMEEYKALTGKEYESISVIEAEQQKVQEEYDAKQKEMADHQANVLREKRDALFADGPNDGTDPGRSSRSI